MVKNMEKAAIYLRLSKEDVEKGEEENSRSIENQRIILEEYAKAHQLQIYDCYIDDDIQDCILKGHPLAGCL